MTGNRSKSFTPFFMVYGVEVVLPTDLQYGSSRFRTYQPNVTEEAQKDTIDWISTGLPTEPRAQGSPPGFPGR
jgi:hypothetical protein